MKKLFTLLMLMVCAIGTAWAGDTFEIKFKSSSSIEQNPTGFFTYDKGAGTAVNWSSKGKHSCTYNGETYSDVIKMESATQAYFSSTAKATVTIVQTTSNATGDKLKFDGVNLDANLANTTVTVDADNKCNIYVITDVEPGDHKITRQSETGLAYIKVEYTGAVMTQLDTPEITKVLAVFDNEETGSQTKQGAGSPFLASIIQRMVLAQGGSLDDYFRAVENAFMISADNAHAYHPNYKDKYDPLCYPKLGYGPAIKYNAAQKYTSDAMSAAIFANICKKAVHGNFVEIIVGGAALSKRVYGENIARITGNFPHWFCPAFNAYSENEASMPFDQHELLALVAPRHVYVASAEDDSWADPKGEYMSAYYAGPAYQLYDMQGLPSATQPAVHQPQHYDVGYHIRSGKHDVTPYDWQCYLDFCDKVFQTKSDR